MTNSTIVVLFTGFFTEPNHNHVLATKGKPSDLATFAASRKPSLGTKPPWFCASYISNRDLRDKGALYKAMGEDYPPIMSIIDSRNTISHAEEDHRRVNQVDAKRSRVAAEELVA